MATVGGTSVVNITSRIVSAKGNALNVGGQPVAVFRVATGQTPGDTVALGPVAQVPVIGAIYGPVTHNIPITNVTGVTSVTVTVGTLSTGTATTVGAFDVWLFGPLPTS